MHGEVGAFGRGRVRRGLIGLALAACAAVALAGCSGMFGGGESNPKMFGLYDDIPEGGGGYKIGDPYQVDGQWFYPRADPAYDRVGVASWYGEYFHGRKTANGEWYDMNRLSAAHPTLPLPVYARVTNLQNGRSLVVRVNDRGPFRRGREIDLSKEAARELGFLREGTAKVRVTYLTDAPLDGDIPQMQTVDRMDRLAPRRTAAAPRGPAAASPWVTGAVRVADPAPPRPALAAPTPIVPPGFYVQAAAFTSPDRAQSLADALADLGDFAVLPVRIGDDTLYRVRSGPLADYGDAAGAAAALAAAGHEGARVFENR